MGKKGDLSDFERGMVVGADGLVWVFQKLLIYWDFHTQPSLGFTENGLKKRKYPVSGSCVDENALLMSEVIPKSVMHKPQAEGRVNSRL